MSGLAGICGLAEGAAGPTCLSGHERMKYLRGHSLLLAGNEVLWKRQLGINLPLYAWSTWTYILACVQILLNLLSQPPWVYIIFSSVTFPNVS